MIHKGARDVKLLTCASINEGETESKKGCDNKNRLHDDARDRGVAGKKGDYHNFSLELEPVS
jgi:hypothetical protein